MVAIAIVTSTLIVSGASAATSSTSHSSARVASACSVVPASGVHVSRPGSPCVVTVAVGEQFHVSLDAGWRWSNPLVSTGVVRLGKVTRGPNGGLQTTVVALRLGRSTIAATGTIICKPGIACPALARLWSLRVVVSNTRGPRTYVALLADSGKTFTIHVGDHFVLNLIGSNPYTWTVPTSNVAAVLALVGDSMGTTLRATYLAVAPGTVRISATNNPSCYPECLAPSRLYEVRVQVLA